MSVDVLIVGAGPAGVSAALWARSLDLDPVLIEEGELGGQLHHVHFHPDDLAFAPGGDGAALARMLAEQLKAAGLAPRRAGAAALEVTKSAAAVRTTTGERIEAPAILIATGVRRRRLEVPGERELEGRGVSFSASLDMPTLARRTVMVAGGGDAAYENALMLSDQGARVTLLVRDEPRARAEFRERVANAPAIDVLERTHVVRVLGTDRMTGVRRATPAGEVERAADGIVIKVGVVPNTGWCAGVLARDPEGYLHVDGRLRTSHPRVWAAGDVVHPRPLGIAVALGHGAIAAASIRDTLHPA